MAGQDKVRAVHRAIQAGPLLKTLASQSRRAPALNVSKQTEDLNRLPEFTEVRRLRAREVPPKVMASALEAMTQLEELDIFGTRLQDLDVLRGYPIRRLRIVWAHKITDLEPLGSLSSLETAIVGDMKRVSNFAPLARCSSLTALHIEAGMWANQPVESLSFLRKMQQLRELSTHYLNIPGDDLAPICSLKNLEWLSLPTKYPVREYARLSVCLPDCECAEFDSHTTYRVGSLAEDGDPEAKDGFTYVEHGILVGRPSTAFKVSESKSASIIAKRAALIEAWREHYRSVAEPEYDTLETLG